MYVKKYGIGFITYFVSTLIAAVVVMFLYSLIVHGAGEIDWGTAFVLAILSGIVFPMVGSSDKKKEEGVET